MATILSIETSTAVCSVALSSDGYILHHKENFDGLNHATLLSDFIHDCLEYLKSHDGMKLDAVAVSIGPGSYTGLRIGLSEAKGLAYGRKLPLIGINSLEIIAVGAMFELADFDSETDLLVPMIDARRDEVYSMALDPYWNVVSEPKAEILTPESYKGFHPLKRKIFAGNGAKKASEILSLPPNYSIFLPKISPLATSMCPLVEKSWQEKKFIDIAYSVPLYLKEFQATTPRRKI